MGHHDRFEYLHELEKVLQTHNAKFIWAHRGASRRVIHKNYAKKVKEMLNRYNNIYVNISWIVYDDIVCKDQEPKKKLGRSYQGPFGRICDRKRSVRLL